ncbi:TetR family transcriptional regulator [Streptomyces sp. Li-HN-5-11]|uniref:TetR/AcrR family transcriptional regulator n=1 Tax=Streptomyces sp. Li-HN-5-11 TaxID=3075432 RepID=UPI0028ABCFA3|nr:TetR family transcriptional regulator [Streptomyces sp. Li-HN-5-11]WNM34757.1 TetR family transcriptional regulator [Streptomyces sp. Li-HN-5-11]
MSEIMPHRSAGTAGDRAVENCAGQSGEQRCGRLSDMGEAGSPGRKRTTRAARSQSRDPQRVKDSAATREAILRAASRRFAERGFAHVTLQEIADDAGVTPALVNRYFVSKRALFELVAAQVRVGFEWDTAVTPENLAAGLIDFWKDPVGREPALALVRSIDLDDGLLLRRELEKRIRNPFRGLLEGTEDAEVRIRLLESLIMGFGLFGTGALVGEDRDDASSTEEAITRFLERMIKACLEG